MANGLYDTARNDFLTGGISWTTDTIKVNLIDTGVYTVDLTNHQFYSAVPSSAVIASTSLANTTAVAGVADADDPAFPTVTSGKTVGAVIIYKDTGTASTSPLIAYIDTATGLPITTSGGNVIIQFSSGSNRIFRL